MSENPKLRSDDEVELTNNITGPGSMRSKVSDSEANEYPLDIVVKKDVTWTSAHLDDD